MDVLTLTAALVRWLTFLGLGLAIGAVAFRWVVARDGDAGRRAARAGAAAAWLLAPLAVARFGVQLAEFRDPLEPWAAEAGVLLGLPVAWAWGLQLLAAIVAALAFRAAAAAGDGAPAGTDGAPGPERAWRAAAAACVVLAFVPAFSGHAFGVMHGWGLAVFADGVHVLAAGGWIGGLAILGAAVRAPRRSAPSALAMVRRFSPLALACAAALAASGVVGTLFHLDGVASLWTRAWGRTLLLKLALVAAVLGAGFHNWRRATPRLAASGDAAALRRSIALELALAAAVLLATAFLVATPPPVEG